MSEFEGLQIIDLSPVTVVAIGERYSNIDELMVRELRNPLIEIGTTAVPPLVVIDLSHTKYFGSTFIEVLLRLNKALVSQDGGKLAFCGLSEYCREVFEITKLSRLWEFYETREDAVKALGSGT